MAYIGASDLWFQAQVRTRQRSALVGARARQRPGPLEHGRRPSSQVSNDRYHQRWTPADAGGQRITGRAESGLAAHVASWLRDEEARTAKRTATGGAQPLACTTVDNAC
jgi:hypothetical protein